MMRAAAAAKMAFTPAKKEKEEKREDNIFSSNESDPWSLFPSPLSLSPFSFGRKGKGRKKRRARKRERRKERERRGKRVIIRYSWGVPSPLFSSFPLHWEKEGGRRKGGLIKVSICHFFSPPSFLHEVGGWETGRGSRVYVEEEGG